MYTYVLEGKAEYRKLQRCTRMYCTVYMGNMGERGYRPKSCWKKTMIKGKRREESVKKGGHTKDEEEIEVEMLKRDK
jgi:hypothetical protein